MIAVFSEEFNLPIVVRGCDFVLVRSIQDIRGVKFTGVITFGHLSDKTKIDCYMALEERQPELFNKFKRLN